MNKKSESRSCPFCGLAADARANASYFQLLQSHRQLADTLAGGVEDRIADGGVGSDIAEFAEALDAGRIDAVVLLGKQDHLDARRVGVYRHQIVGEIVIDVSRITLVK